MAKLIYIKDVFSKEREECEIEAGRTLGEITREKCQGTRMVEAYNVRTGETFSKPAEVKLAISVNDKIVDDLTYQVKEDDNIAIAAVPGDPATLLSIVALVSIAVVAIIGVATMANMSFDDGGGKQKSALELENLPDVRGSKNQSIRDKRVPMVFGRHLVTPLVAGEGWNRIPYGTEIEPEKVLTNVNVSWVETNSKEIQDSTGYNYSAKAAFTRYTGHIDVSLTRMPTHPLTVNVHVAYCSARFIKTTEGWAGKPGYSQKIGAAISVSSSARSKDITVTVPAFSTSASSGDITSDCSAGIPTIIGISVEGGEDALWKGTKGSVKCEVVARTDAGREKIHGYTGKDCYARFLYCAGYAPLKLTQIKLDELMLSHNGGDGNNRPVMHGMMSGCDLTDDNGDILRKWKENEIRMEILQKGSRSELYPQKIKQDTIDANILHVVEGEIDEINQYKGERFASGQRTNSIRFTPSCPMAIEVELQAVQGLYRQRTHMDGGSEVCYYPLSCWVAIQWRPHCANTKSADAEGAGSAEGWRTFTTVNSVPHRTFTEAERQADKDCHVGTNWPSKETNDRWIGAELFNLSDCQRKDGVIDGNGRLLDKGVSQARFIARYDMTWEDIKLLCGKGDTKPDLDSVEVRAVRVSPSYVNEQSGGTTWGPWTYNDIVKWSYVRSEIFDKDKALDVIKSGNSSGWQEKIMRSAVPDEFWSKYCFIAIEVKADSNEIKGELDKINMVGECLAPTFNPRTGEWSAASEELTDHLIWDGENWQKCIDADTSDGSVAWRKARADWVLGGRIGKAPRTARAGATLFGNSGRLGVIQQAIFTNASFDTNRQRWYLTEEDEARFVTANPASMYLLAMCGPHLGVEAKGYNRINMASVEALWEWSRHVTDGYMEDGKLREMEFTVNGYLTDEIKESELVARVLTAARSFQTIDDEGRYMVVIDKKRDWPVMQINQENALELSNSRSFGKDVSGLKVTFTDANDGWQKNIIYAMGRYATEFYLK